MGKGCTLLEHSKEDKEIIETTPTTTKIDFYYSDTNVC